MNMTTTLKELVRRTNKADGGSSRNVLNRLISSVQLHRAADGRIFAEVPVGDRTETYELKARGFRDWLVNGYYHHRGHPPSTGAISGFVGVLEARARFLSAAPSVFVRVAQYQDGGLLSQYLDLGDPCGRAIQIRASGWSVVRRPPVHFRRPEGYLQLPMPRVGGSIHLLRPYVNVGESDFRLLVAWLTAAMRPVGPYPILTIYGEQGSGKSTLAKIVRLLVDPQAAPLIAEPQSTRDLMSIALNGWLTAFDNVSTIPNWFSDSLCRLAVGGGCAARSLRTNDDVTYMSAQRPVVLNGIDDFMKRGDLIDRSLFLNLPAIVPADRRAEAEFWASFKGDYPIILGALLDAAVLGLRGLPSLDLPELPRMADFGLWGEAVSRGLGWPREAFLSAYIRNRREATTEAVEDSPVAAALLSTMPTVEKWTGTCARLRASLTAAVPMNTAASACWPKSTSLFSTELRRVAPQLRLRGINITFGRNSGHRLVTITTQ
jgi:energy-coupling factor transporter ATP-binding protein EcfA2